MPIIPTKILVVRPLIALHVEERVAVPQLLLALLAERDARALTMPHQHVARLVAHPGAADPVAARLARYARRTLKKKTK